MSQYMLSCTCGQAVLVEPRQAGEQVTCTCGARLEVPPLRQLRGLPLAPATDSGKRSTWNVRKGVISAGLVLAALFSVVAGLSWFTKPSLPKFDPTERMQVVDERLANLSPAEAWRLWVDVYVPLDQTGLSEFQHLDEASIQQQISRHRFFTVTMLIPAGLFLASAALAAVWR
jgi:hypothetical protein